MSDCSTCRDAKESILTHKEHRAGCLGCEARAIAQAHGEGKPEHALQVMSLTWTEAKRFQRGRSHYFWWRGLISEAKEKT